jgi:hypothetical protein
MDLIIFLPYLWMHLENRKQHDFDRPVDPAIYLATGETSRQLSG